MSEYRRAKKYLRFIVPALIVTGAILVPKVDHPSKAETLGTTTNKSANNPLRVNQSGRQMYTNVTADRLQPAAAPAGSATSASLSPQQAVPNYCAPGETPYVDGCITQ